MIHRTEQQTKQKNVLHIIIFKQKVCCSLCAFVVSIEKMNGNKVKLNVKCRAKSECVRERERLLMMLLCLACLHGFVWWSGNLKREKIWNRKSDVLMIPVLYALLVCLPLAVAALQQ